MLLFSSNEYDRIHPMTSYEPCMWISQITVALMNRKFPFFSCNGGPFPQVSDLIIFILLIITS